mmetsp:Transcript_29768/g.53023  ORF Transcript_29768/g.53023 Transcript_29768/m.53023 type:complete len:141 (-) Transcript_29768:16-438(-)
MEERLKRPPRHATSAQSTRRRVQQHITVAPKLYDNQVFLDVFDSQGRHERLLADDVESPVVFNECEDSTQLRSPMGAPPNSFDALSGKEPLTVSTLTLLEAKLSKAPAKVLTVKVDESFSDHDWQPLRLDRHKGKAGFFK